MSSEIILKLYMLGFVLSCIMQSFFQSWFAENSFWKQNKGWQNEIAIWNVGIFIILYGVVQSSVSYIIEVRLGLFALSFLFSLNHFIALRKSKLAISHILGGVTNLLGMALILVSFL